MHHHGMRRLTLKNYLDEYARPWLQRLIGFNTYQTSLALDLENMKAQLAELDELRARLAELEGHPPQVQSPAYDPLASVPLYPPGITDRHNLASKIFRDQI